MKILRNLLVALAILACGTAMAQSTPQSFYDLKALTLRGKEFNFSSLRGQKVLIVNTASKCGYTKQYADLQEVFDQYGGDKFTIIGFPSNDFKNQEPGSNDDIETFCRVNFGVTFQMMDKVHVVGDSISSVYRWLTNKSENGALDSQVKWNFQKYMIDENGKLVGVAMSKEKPNSKRIVEWIKTGKLAEE